MLLRFEADIFQALSHPTRIAIVELLREGEITSGGIIERLGLEQANASQHLAVLRAARVVQKRKSGNQGFYSISSPLVVDLLDTMRHYFQQLLSESQEILKELQAEPGAPSAPESAR